MTGAPARRWLNEQAVLAEMERLSDASMERVAEYGQRAEAAAHKEADYKRLRARAILKAQADTRSSGGRASVAQAETVADADDEVSTAYLERLVTAAQADATKEALRSLRTNLEALRTAAASARDGVTGPGWSGR